MREVKDSKAAAKPRGKKNKAVQQNVAPMEPMDQTGAGPALPRDMAAEEGLEA